MALTLYRQYRPTTFSALFGQDTARTILQNALNQDRLSHAYLFSGPRGTGKTTTARILARAATCEHPVTKEKKGASVFEPCNTCASCVAQLQDQAPDIVEIDAASNRGIEDIRQLREQAHYLPLSLKKKVYIIDEVHMLTSDAFNALLKTLEEPPKHCVFILATTELHKVPATIRSRCQLIRFERGSVESISAKLDHIVASSGWEAEEGVTKLIAEHAQGGFRDAETLLEQLGTRFAPLTLKKCIDALGITDADQVEQLFEAVQKGSLTETRLALTAIEVNDQHRCEMLMTELIERTRAKIYTSPAPTEEQLIHLTGGLTFLLEGFVLIKGSPHPKLVLESTCYEIAASGQKGIRADAAPILEDSHPAAPATEERITLPATPAPAAPRVVKEAISVTPEPVREPKAPVVELRESPVRDVRQAWKEMIKAVGRDSAPMAQMLREAVIHTAEDFIITVHIKYKFHVEKLSEKKHRTRVEGLLEQITHDKWIVDYQLKDTLPRRSPAKEITAATAEAAAAVFGATA